ncbi:MAG: AraC family transcriptional regulator [Candidatus Pristimantibacillus lignocellulolyticus]|uniref:AraC family transcriptional regulator n=1 Tax=Candidatus Pristimantibacillus lignocellulolyticus TaxID=2994561 RepID=A0A9J6ZI74_9BACL|nr:MAG: AraC family transcriptional regulator [Candidatus Pristimantibacillus lignocellulolyticus]
MNKLFELVVFGRLLFDAIGLPVFIIQPGRAIEAEYTDQSFHTNPYWSSIREQVAGYAYVLYPAEHPVHFTRSRLSYFFVNALDENQLAGTLVVGPYIHEKPQGDKWNEIITYLPQDNRREFLQLVEEIPLISSKRSVDLSRMIYYAVHKKLVDSSTSFPLESMLIPELDAEKKQLNAELSRRRRNGMLHSNLSHERVMLHYVRNGERERIRTFVTESIIAEDEFGVLSKRSRIRSEKNLMITGIALICRAAIEGGVHEEDALTLSDFYIQQLEEKETLQAISAIMTKVLFDFVDRVSEVRRGHYSHAIQTSIHEIANHLYGEITLERLATYTNFSPNYLSSLFKKEVGLTIAKYVQRERIEEAKRLLTLTDYPIADIAAWLNFNDQSYFNRVFKKWTGMAPKEYRKNER